MKRTIYILLVLSAFAGCISTSNKHDRFEGILIITADKSTTSGGQVSVDSTWLFKFFNDDYTIFKLPKIEFKDSKTKMRQDTIDLVLAKPDTTYKYYIIKGTDSIGIQYDNGLKMVRTFSLDSLLRASGIHPDMFGAYELKLPVPDKIERHGGITIEKYANKKIADGDSDSIYRYFDIKLNGMKFSFSPLLDSEKKGKLFRTSFINLYSGNIVRTEFYAEFKKAETKDQSVLKELVGKYNTDWKLLQKQ